MKMREKDYRKEEMRRAVRDTVFKCLCGAMLFGRNKDYKTHLYFDCPVYKEAYNKLKKLR